MDLTEEELKEFRNKIYEAYNEFLKTKNLYALANFILWCYEYLESYASTQLQTNTKMTIIKEYFKSVGKWKDDYQDVIKNLFFIRLKIVRRPFLIDYFLDENISYVNKHTSINPIIFYNDNIEILTEILKVVEVELEIEDNENNVLKEDNSQETDNQEKSKSDKSDRQDQLAHFFNTEIFCKWGCLK